MKVDLYETELHGMFEELYKYVRAMEVTEIFKQVLLQKLYENQIFFISVLFLFEDFHIDNKNFDLKVKQIQPNVPEHYYYDIYLIYELRKFQKSKLEEAQIIKNSQLEETIKLLSSQVNQFLQSPANIHRVTNLNRISLEVWQ